MKDGEILLASLLQSDGTTKDRPVLLLRRMPPFQDYLVCGVSSQLQQAAAGFDELISPTDADFRTSGLKAASVIRLGFLAVLPPAMCKGRLGSISAVRLKRLLTTLSDHLRP
jgi:mRNA interferase MazF